MCPVTVINSDKGRFSHVGNVEIVDIAQIQSKQLIAQLGK